MTGLGHIAPYITFTDFPKTGVFIEDAIFHGNVSYWQPNRIEVGYGEDFEPLGITINWSGNVE